MPCFYGIDPGITGGLAIIHQDDRMLPQVYPFRWTTDEIYVRLFADRLKGNDKCFQCNTKAVVVIERISSAIHGINKSSQSKLYGMYRGTCLLLTSLGQIYFDVPGSKWQRGLGIEKRRPHETTREWKRRLQQFAIELGYNVSLDVADCVLLAEYGKRMWNGTLVRGKKATR